MGKRTNSMPMLIQDGEKLKFTRMPLNQRSIDEGWLQEFIRNHPEILPVEDIDSVFGPVVSIGREAPTDAGLIDNLFISPYGYITLVETKLWKNPEARREVVGQVIDYAKEVSRWTFSELDKRVHNYNRRYLGKDIGVIDSIGMLEQIDEVEEADLVDTIIRNMRQGRFLLMIVGDGIRESVEELVAFMQNFSNLHFTLALVELQIYEIEESNHESLLIIPQVITRTKEVIRAIVKVEHDIQGISPRVQVDIVDETDKIKSTSRRFTITEEAFFETLQTYSGIDGVEFSKRIIKDVESLGCVIEWKQGSFVVKLPEPSGSGIRLTLFVISKDAYFYVGWLPYQLERAGIDPSLAFEYVQDLSQVFSNCTVNPKDKSTVSRMIKLAELQEQYEDVKLRVERLIHDIANNIKSRGK